MIITNVKTTPLKTGALIVEIETDEGIKGLGECYIVDPIVTKTFIDQKLTPLIKGKDPTNVVSLWDEMFYSTTPLSFHRLGQHPWLRRLKMASSYEQRRNTQN